MNIQQIREAVARGWCTPENANKEVDVVLAEAISQSVLAALQEGPEGEDGPWAPGWEQRAGIAQ